MLRSVLLPDMAASLHLLLERHRPRCLTLLTSMMLFRCIQNDAHLMVRRKGQAQEEDLKEALRRHHDSASL